MPSPRRSPRRRALRIAALLTVAEIAAVSYRRGSLLSIDTVVRCRRGHLFTTWWVPGVSVKSLRFGWWRLQRCPVGSHWSLVTPGQTSQLTYDERRSAREHHDARIP
jgi:hypothetical protein